MFENGVHVGLPIRRAGLCSFSKCSARFLCAGMLKSQALPFSSLQVRSSATPGMMPMCECRAAAAVTLGAEYTSATVAFSRDIVSRR